MEPASISGLKLMLGIALVFALCAIYGQWQHSRRARVETAAILPAPTASPAPSPNEP